MVRLFLLCCGVLACSSKPAPESAPAPAAPAPVPVAAPDPSLKLSPEVIRWDGEESTLSIEVLLEGPSLASRAEVVHVGVTVVTEADRVIDLIVHTLFPGAFDQPLWFSTELPNDVPKHILVGAWGTKIEPCDVARPGCEQFGFVLDDSLASFPPLLYTDGMRQRMVPDGFTIAVKGDAEVIRAVTEAYGSVFGSAVVLSKAEDLTLQPGVYVGQADDLGFAHAVATSHDPDLPYSVAEGLTAPMVVVLP